MRLRNQRPAAVFSILVAGLLATVSADSYEQTPRTRLIHDGRGAAFSARDAALKANALADYDAGRLSEALPVLLDLSQRFPGQGDLQAATGMCLLESARLEEGAKHLEAAHRLLPGHGEITQNLGVAYLKLHRPQQALPLLQSASAATPRNHEYKVALAQAQRETGNLKAAAALYAQAAALQAPQPDLLYDWAGTLLAAGETAKASEVIRRIPATAADASVEELKGEIEEKAGHPEAALAAFQRAAELNPSAANIQVYGEELLRHWTFPAAATIFQYGVNRYPENTRLRLDLGIAHFGNNDFARSSEVFSTLLTQDPDSGMLADLLGRSCSAAASLSSAPVCDGLAAFARKHPANAAASLYAAITLLQRPEDSDATREAEGLLQQALKANAKLPEAWYQLGVVQQQRQDWGASEASLQRALALRPGYSEAHYRLSRAYAHTGRTDQARTEMALQRDSAAAAKTEQQKRMEGVLTFLTTPN